jgi:hypothetical protein
MSSRAGIRRAEARWPGLRLTVSVVGGLCGFTALGAVLGALAPGLAPDQGPHPALVPTLGTAASILLTNARVIAAPYLLCVFRFGADHRARRVGDAIVAGILAVNALRIGVALGRWQGRLIPYIPQLPLEYLAAAVAASAWIAVRNQVASGLALALSAVLSVLILMGGAALETFATPHTASTPTVERTTRPSGPRGESPRAADQIESAHTPRGSVGFPSGQLAPPAADSLQGRVRSLPLAALGSAPPPRRMLRLVSTTRSRGGTT